MEQNFSTKAMTIEDFKEGMMVKMIVPSHRDCLHGRAGVPYGEIGKVVEVTSRVVYVIFPNWVDPTTNKNCDWRTIAWTGGPHEFEKYSEEWWDIWLG